jgi:hypothetical protein
MVSSVRAKFAASFLVVSLLASPAVYAAADNAEAEKPAQAAPDDAKSYLPPWMQGGNVGQTTPARRKADAPRKTAQIVDADAQKKKARQSQIPQNQRPAPESSAFLRGVAELFGAH